MSNFSGEASKQIHEYKFKLQKAEQDIATLEGMVSDANNIFSRLKPLHDNLIPIILIESAIYHHNSNPCNL